MQFVGVQKNKKSWHLPAILQFPHILLALAHKGQDHPQILQEFKKINQYQYTSKDL